MVVVEICIGSACYVKGSDQAVKMLQELVKKNNWEDKVEIKGSFCMQQCQKNQGLGVAINGEKINDIGLHNFEEIVENKIKEVL